MAKASIGVDAILARIQRVTEQTAETLRQELGRIEDEKQRLTADLDAAAERIRRTLGELGHRTNSARVTKAAPRPARARTRRVRRGREQLEREAEAIFQIIRAAGADGAAGRDIRKHHPKVGPDIKGFVQKYSKHKVRTTGKKASTRYHAA